MNAEASTTTCPIESLLLFVDHLEIGESDLGRLRPHRRVFIERKHDFADFFYNQFRNIRETRIILDHERHQGFMKSVWARWFETFFSGNVDEPFLRHLWRSGHRHVEVNLDQRYVNLGYTLVRRFCHEIIDERIAQSERAGVAYVINKMLDLCLLVETQAYISGSAHCDREVIKGIAHQVRNPITVIGGNIKRLQRSLDAAHPTYRVYETIIQENLRLERMVTDIGVYIDLFQGDTRFDVVRLDEILDAALTRVSRKFDLAEVRVERELDPDHTEIQGDSRDLEILFYYLLENSVEALDPGRPLIRITSRSLRPQSEFLQVRLFNTGLPPQSFDLNNAFTPFYSSKPTGTGFGLSIARLAVNKNLGSIALQRVGDEGTECLVTLPLPAENGGP